MGEQPAIQTESHAGTVQVDFSRQAQLKVLRPYVSCGLGLQSMGGVICDRYKQSISPALLSSLRPGLGPWTILQHLIIVGISAGMLGSMKCTSSAARITSSISSLTLHFNR